VSGDAWREAWKERVYHVAESGEPCVERSAHKWASDSAAGEEWEERWGEWYAAAGEVNKWAEKWGKRGGDVRPPHCDVTQKCAAPFSAAAARGARPVRPRS
jgi:hypothetical protein